MPATTCVDSLVTRTSARSGALALDAISPTAKWASWGRRGGRHRGMRRRKHAYAAQGPWGTAACGSLCRCALLRVQGRCRPSAARPRGRARPPALRGHRPHARSCHPGAEPCCEGKASAGRARLGLGARGSETRGGARCWRPGATTPMAPRPACRIAALCRSACTPRATVAATGPSCAPADAGREEEDAQAEQR
jgi:hypothetical protein